MRLGYIMTRSVAPMAWGRMVSCQTGEISGLKDGARYGGAVMTKVVVLVDHRTLGGRFRRKVARTRPLVP